LKYNVIELCEYADFDMLLSDTVMLVPIDVDIHDHIESFWFEYQHNIDGDYSKKETYIKLKDGVDYTEMIEKFIKQMEMYGCIISKKTTISFGD
jgi:hypothetical protein